MSAKITADVGSAPPCPECGGRTIEWRFAGKDTQSKLCSRWREPGHLSEAAVRDQRRRVLLASMPPSRRFS